MLKRWLPRAGLVCQAPLLSPLFVYKTFFFFAFLALQTSNSSIQDAGVKGKGKPSLQPTKDIFQE